MYNIQIHMFALSLICTKYRSSIGSARASADDYVQPTLKSHSKAATVRSVAENQVHIASMMYSDISNRDTQMITLVAAEAATDWHSAQNKQLRTLSSVHEWELRQIQVGLKELLTTTLKAALDDSSLKKCGLDQTWDSDMVRRLHTDARMGKLVEQRDRAQLLHSCVFSLLLRRCVSLLPLGQSWPRCFVLLQGNPYCANAALLELKTDYDMSSCSVAEMMIGRRQWCTAQFSNCDRSSRLCACW